MGDYVDHCPLRAEGPHLPLVAGEGVEQVAEREPFVGDGGGDGVLVDRGGGLCLHGDPVG